MRVGRCYTPSPPSDNLAYTKFRFFHCRLCQMKLGRSVSLKAVSGVGGQKDDVVCQFSAYQRSENLFSILVRSS